MINHSNRNFISIVLSSFILLISGLTGINFLTAQTMDPTVLSSASGEGKSTTLSLTWTLGETAVSSGYTTNQLFTEGFHQPRMILSPSNFKGDQFSITLAPNPAHAQIRLDIVSSIQTELSVYLHDVRGSQILYSRLPSGSNQALLNLEGITPGIYFLQIRSSTGLVFKSFKVIKI